MRIGNGICAPYRAQCRYNAVNFLPNPHNRWLYEKELNHLQRLKHSLVTLHWLWAYKADSTIGKNNSGSKADGFSSVIPQCIFTSKYDAPVRFQLLDLETSFICVHFFIYM